MLVSYKAYVTEPLASLFDRDDDAFIAALPPTLGTKAQLVDDTFKSGDEEYLTEKQYREEDMRNRTCPHSHLPIDVEISVTHV